MQQGPNKKKAFEAHMIQALFTTTTILTRSPQADRSNQPEALESCHFASPPLSPMDRFRPLRRIQVEPEPTEPPAPAAGAGGDAEKDESPAPAAGLLMGTKVRRRAALYRDCKGDYIGIPNDPSLTKILSKQGSVVP